MKSMNGEWFHNPHVVFFSSTHHHHDKIIQDTYKEFGIFVCRFFKDCSLMYVIIDDRIPVKNKDGRPIFGHATDPNELWILLLEKSYAKLHGITHFYVPLI